MYETGRVSVSGLRAARVQPTHCSPSSSDTGLAEDPEPIDELVVGDMIGELGEAEDSVLGEAHSFHVCEQYLHQLGKRVGQ